MATVPFRLNKNAKVKAVRNGKEPSSSLVLHFHVFTGLTCLLRFAVI